ncbi:General transcription factor II-I repeat domain-containing protein 2A [Thelohanellus kitauei]|uniref:General transcription factor II-I repeat domain-containing protein 2A n=1 Tax=Thelohanellus kitauei TaxID=669202 RepID=A0A0C2J4L7_THEKT|nr:General transcription factor II-I repeat domain-containing protein 2A [Thelohanellus kitauei]
MTRRVEEEASRSFFRAINDNFVVIEELLGFEALHSSTRGSDLYETPKNLGEKNNLEWRKLVSICTEGPPAVVDSKSGCLTLLEQFPGRPILKYHCLLNQEALCGKKMNLKNVVDVVVRCVNKICKSVLNRLEFRQFLSDMNEEYGELLLHCEVRWLSKGKVLSRFWALKNSIYLFLSEIDESHT